MRDFIIVTAADFKRTPVLASFGGRALNARMSAVPWSGTAEQLHRRVSPFIPGIVLVASLDGDCLLIGN